MPSHRVASIYWVRRGESVTLGSKSVGNCSDAPRPLHFDEVSQMLMECAEDFAPYPPCLPRHIKPIDAYLVAIAEDTLCGADVPTATARPKNALTTATAATKDATAPMEASAMKPTVTISDSALAAAIGVAWVDLMTVPRAPANAVQGYLQIVVTRSGWRRRGVGRAMLNALLRTKDRAGIMTGAIGGLQCEGAREAYAATSPLLFVPTASENATRENNREADGSIAIARPVTSWMLHTMAADSVATRAYLRHRLLKAKRTTTPCDGEKPLAEAKNYTGNGENNAADKAAAEGGLNTSSPAAPVADIASQVEVQLAQMRGVTALYEGFGFTTRRTLYRYYGNLADAIEMIRQESGARKVRRTEL